MRPLLDTSVSDVLPAARDKTPLVVYAEDGVSGLCNRKCPNQYRWYPPEAGGLPEACVGLGGRGTVTLPVKRVTSGARSPPRHPASCSGAVGPGEQPEELGDTQSLCPPRISNVRPVCSLVSALEVRPPRQGACSSSTTSRGRSVVGRWAHAFLARRVLGESVCDRVTRALPPILPRPRPWS